MSVKTGQAHYKLAPPSAPLVLPEFREPLFLSIYCQAAQHRPSLLAGAPPGISTVLDAYLDEMDGPVCAIADADPDDRVVRQACLRLVEKMRATGRPHLTSAEAKAVLESVHGSQGFSRSLMAGMLGERILADDYVSADTGIQRVVRFSYERLADHLMATTIISQARRSDRSFNLDELAGAIEALPAGGGTLDALAICLPEVVGVELVDVMSLEEDRERTAVERRVLRSLPLRVPSKITHTAEELLRSALLNSDRRNGRLAADIAISVACRAGHSLDAEWLHRTLLPLSMADRDATWSVAITGERLNATPYRPLLRWLRQDDQQAIENLSKDSARAIATTAMWAFTCPDRFLRDQMTRWLLRLTSAHPDVLPTLLSRAAEIDDLYVLERVCAVAYGTALRGIESVHLRAIATVLDEQLFSGEPPIHILVRDYARGIMQLAHRRELVSGETWLRSAGPWSSPWPGKSVPTVDDFELDYPAFDGDGSHTGDPLWLPLHNGLFGLGDFGVKVIGTDFPHGFPFTSAPAPWLEVAEQRHESSVEPDEDEPSGLLEQWVQDPDMPNKLRTQLQDLLDHAAELSNARTVRREGFDTKLVSRFVFAGVVERGWTPERFGAIDRHLAQNSGDSGRSAHKRERVAKKYQWQALHEAYARIADTHALRDSAELPYPLGLDIAVDGVRDIDPTHLLTGNPDGEADDAHEIQSSSFYPEPGAPVLTTWESHTQWIKDPSAMIDTSSLQIVSGTALLKTPAGQALGVTADSQWIVMSSTVAWNWDQFGRTSQLSPELWADHAVVEHTLLITAEEADSVLRQAPERYQPFEFRNEFVDGPFLGEVPSQSHYQALLSRRQLDGRDDDAFGVGAPATAAVDRYAWEGSILDCSIHSTVSVSFPSKELFDILAPGGTVRDGGTYDLDGTLVAFCPGAYQADDDIDLYVRADFMSSALRASGYNLLRVTFQERRGGVDLHSHGKFAGMRTRTSVHVHVPAGDGTWRLLGTAPHQDELVPPRTG